MKDNDRAQDSVFQIGQSKAIRNVIVAALSWLTDEAESTAKSGILDKIGRNPERFREELIRRLVQLEIGVERVERVVGRTRDKWLAPDMAKLFAQVSAIKDGMADSEDLFPTDAAEAAELADASQVEQQQGESGPTGQDKPKQERQARKPADKPKQEPPKEEPKKEPEQAEDEHVDAGRDDAGDGSFEDDGLNFG